MRSNDCEAGSATVWVLACGLLLAAVAAAPLLRELASLDRHRASVAADLSAIAAAQVADAPGGTVAAGCQAAASVASANGARMDSCRPVGCGSNPAPVRAAVDGRAAVPPQLPAPATSFQVLVSVVPTRLAAALGTALPPANAVARAGPTPGCSNAP